MFRLHLFCWNFIEVCCELTQASWLGTVQFDGATRYMLITHFTCSLHDAGVRISNPLKYCLNIALLITMAVILAS